ncbi:MAG: methionine--tRNA ligase [Candidatus Aminicenantales bacterium]
MEKSSDRKSFYVTTPIYYVNDIPHIGHAYTTIIADALARFNRLRGREVFFLTGTDEHGQKVEKAATERGLSPKEHVDRIVGRFADLWKALDISNDGFIRTTDPGHERGVQKVFQILREKGDIYKGTYQGWYCVSDENFIADDVAMGPEGHKTCPDCGKPCTLVAEECYFFRLSAYQDRLLEFYAANPEFVRPPSRMNEVTSFVRQGLRDLSITRTTVKWGVPVPDDPKHTIYVWFDALHNYLTGVGYGTDEARFRKFWPADVHLMAKDILRFHAIFWPAFLMAAGIPLPKCVFSHGWWLKDNTKMSKSRGNVLDPNIILRTFGADALRYFLLREIPIGLDGNFSHEGFLHRVNSDLANDLGNLVQRTLTMVRNYFGGTITGAAPATEEDERIRAGFDELKIKVHDLYDACALNRALEEVWAYLARVNKYLADHEPWKMAKDPEKRPRLARVLLQALSAVRGVSYLLYPVMPSSCERVWEYLGESRAIRNTAYADLVFDGYAPARPVEEPKALFPRVLLKDFLAEDNPAAAPNASESPKEKTMEGIPVAPPAAPPAPAAPATPAPNVITYEEFMKMDLRVAQILAAERVPNTDKLFKLEIDLGTEKRTMISGIANAYTAEDLVGKRLIVVANLKPARIRGIESQAMLLAAVIDDKAVIPFFDRDVPPGTKVK